MGMSPPNTASGVAGTAAADLSMTAPSYGGGIYGVLGGYSPEQSAMLDEQNAGMNAALTDPGMGGHGILNPNMSTLSSANYAAGAPMTRLSNTFDKAMVGLGNVGPAFGLLGALQQQEQMGLLQQQKPPPPPGRILQPRKFPRLYARPYGPYGR